LPLPYQLFCPSPLALRPPQFATFGICGYIVLDASPICTKSSSKFATNPSAGYEERLRAPSTPSRPFRWHHQPIPTRSLSDLNHGDTARIASTFTFSIRSNTRNKAGSRSLPSPLHSCIMTPVCQHPILYSVRFLIEEATQRPQLGTGLKARGNSPETFHEATDSKSHACIWVSHIARIRFVFGGAR
jgi:hypothetical protein